MIDFSQINNKIFLILIKIRVLLLETLGGGLKGKESSRWHFKLTF